MHKNVHLSVQFVRSTLHLLFEVGIFARRWRRMVLGSNRSARQRQCRAVIECLFITQTRHVYLSLKTRSDSGVAVQVRQVACIDLGLHRNPAV
jgi:hypothetical protein